MKKFKKRFLFNLFFSFLLFIFILPISFLLAQNNGMGSGANLEIISPQNNSIVSGELIFKAGIDLANLPGFYDVDTVFILRKTDGSLEEEIPSYYDSGSTTGRSYWLANFLSNNYPNGNYVLKAHLSYLGYSFRAEPVFFVIENNVQGVESITLSGEGQNIEWNVSGSSPHGFKAIWSKNSGPIYPTRVGDEYRYYSNSDQTTDILNDFDGPGIYHVRVCEYLGEECGTYSNEISLFLGDDNNNNFIAEMITPQNNFIVSDLITLKAEVNVTENLVNYPKFIVSNADNEEIFYATYTGSFNTQNSVWKTNFNSNNYINGSYEVLFSFVNSGDIYNSNLVTFNIQNEEETILEDLSVQIIDFLSGSIVEGSIELIARANLDIDNLNFQLHKDGGIVHTLSAEYFPGTNYWKAILNSADYTDGTYTLIASTSFGDELYETESIVFIISNEDPADDPTQDPADEEPNSSIDDNLNNFDSGLLDVNIDEGIATDFPDNEKDQNRFDFIETKEETGESEEEKPIIEKIKILDFNLIEKVSNDFIINIKSDVRLEKLEFKFKHRDSGKFYISPGIKRDSSGYDWFRDMKIKSLDIGSYEFFAEGVDFNNNVFQSKKEMMLVEEQKIEEINTATNINIPFINSLCLEKKITSLEECENFLQLDLKCRNNNITVKSECDRFLFVKNMPSLCRKFNAKSDEECKVIIEREENNFNSQKEETVKIANNILDKQCIDNNIEDINICKEFLIFKNLNQECLRNEIKTEKECKDYLKNKYILPECEKVGIMREKDCQDYLFEKYSPTVDCKDNDIWKCKNIIKEEYIGDIVINHKVNEKIKVNILNNTHKITSINTLKSSLDDYESIVSFKEDNLKIKIIKAEEKTILTKSENLLQVLPIAIMIDSDEDGLSDDMEKKLGTDINNPDTDGDGHMDGVEMESGYNPLVSAKDLSQDATDSGKILLNKISPLEKAILKKMPIEQPKISGEISAKLTVGEVSNISNESEGESGYKILGKGIPGEFVSLYIYSDMPIVVTTKVNEYGNWEYELENSLIDGEHEIYVVVNDNTGKVVSKSSPLSFFVKEAKAISPSDFISTSSGSNEIQKTEETKNVYLYLLIVVGVIMSSMIVFVLFILRKS